MADSTEISVATLAAEWIRAVRGKRPQALVSRRLGYGSNVAYRWEAGVCVPSASAALRLVEVCGGNVAAALKAFLPSPPAWLDAVDVTSPPGIAQLLAELRGKIPIKDLAAATSISRFAISRWLRGQSEPSLVDLFVFVEKASLRLLDFVAQFTDPAQLPSIREKWEQLVQSRRAAYDHPWSHAVLRALELKEYIALAEHRPGWIARRLSIPESIERESLALLLGSGQASWSGTHYEVSGTALVDTRVDPKKRLGVKTWWTQVALDRMKSGAPGLYSYNLCSLSAADLERVIDLQRKYLRQMSHIIANSNGSEHVVLYAAQLLALDR